MLLNTWCPVDRGRTAGGRAAGGRAAGGPEINATPKGSLLQRDAVEYSVLRWRRLQRMSGGAVGGPKPTPRTPARRLGPAREGGGTGEDGRAGSFLDRRGSPARALLPSSSLPPLLLPCE